MTVSSLMVEAAVTTFFGLLFLGLGLAAVNKGRKRRKRASVVQETETTEARNLRPGKADIKGTARRTEDGSTTKSPISRKEALATKVEEYRQDQDGNEHGGGWRTVYENEGDVPFVTEDRTGEVRVDPTHSETNLNLEMRNKAGVGVGEEPPDDVRRFLESEEEVDAASSASLGPLDFGPRRRYSEGVVEPGDDVYVLGKARKEDAGLGEHEHAISEPTESGEFVVSDKSEEHIVEENKFHGLILLVIGIPFILFGGLVSLVGLASFIWYLYTLVRIL